VRPLCTCCAVSYFLPFRECLTCYEANFFHSYKTKNSDPKSMRKVVFCTECLRRLCDSSAGTVDAPGSHSNDKNGIQSGDTVRSTCNTILQQSSVRPPVLYTLDYHFIPYAYVFVATHDEEICVEVIAPHH
jgi:hypothetical protein